MKNRQGFTVVKLTIAILILALLSIPVTWICVGGCGDSKTICLKGNKDCHEFKEVGLLSGEKNPNVEYRMNTANVVFGVIGVETVVIPVLAFGFWLWEPVGLKNPNKVPGT
jgi:hypothetical protein